MEATKPIVTINEMDVEKINIESTNLENIILRSSDPNEARFCEADLREVHFEELILSGVNFDI